MYPGILSRSNTNEQHLVKWHLKWQVSNKWQVRAKNVILTTNNEYLLRSCVRVPIINVFQSIPNCLLQSIDIIINHHVYPLFCVTAIAHNNLSTIHVCRPVRLYVYRSISDIDIGI